jgi:hypothetical protein
MTRTYPKTSQITHETALTALGTTSESPVNTIVDYIEQNTKRPLRIYGNNTPDSKLYFSANTMKTSIGTERVSEFATDTSVVFPDSWIDFQAQSTSSASIAITFPASTVGFFRRCVFWMLRNGTISSQFTSEVVLEANLPDPLSTYVVGGILKSFVDLECTDISGKFKTIGSTTSVIENITSTISRVHEVTDESRTLNYGDVDPSSVATIGFVGEIFEQTNTPKAWLKQDSGSSTNWNQFIIEGGNTTASTMTIGTKTAQALSVITNNTEKLNIAVDGTHVIGPQDTTSLTHNLGSTAGTSSTRRAVSLMSGASYNYLGGTVGVVYAGDKIIFRTSATTNNEAKIGTGSGDPSESGMISIMAGGIGFTSAALAYSFLVSDGGTTWIHSAKTLCSGAWNFPISTTTPLLKVTSGGTAATGTITLNGTTWKFGAGTAPAIATITEAGVFTGASFVFNTTTFTTTLSGTATANSVLSLPDIATGTLAALQLAQTFSALQTFTAGLKSNFLKATGTKDTSFVSGAVTADTTLTSQDRTGYIADLQDIQNAAADKPSYRFNVDGQSIVCGSSASLALGSGDFSVLWHGIITEVAPASEKFLWYITGATSGLLVLGVNQATAKLYVKTSASGLLDVANVPAGICTIIAKRVGSAVIIYLNGVLIYTATPTLEPIVGSTTITVGRPASNSFLGSCYRFFVTNYALTEASGKIARYSAGATLDWQDQWGSMQTKVTNGDFASDLSYWGYTLGFVWSAGTAKITGTVSNARLGQTSISPAFVVGKQYRITYDVKANENSVSLKLLGSGFSASSPVSNDVSMDSSVGDNKTVVFTCDGTGANTTFALGNAGSIDYGSTSGLALDNISVVQLGAVLALEPKNITPSVWFDDTTNILDGLVTNAIATNYAKNFCLKRTTILPDIGGPGTALLTVPSSVTSFDLDVYVITAGAKRQRIKAECFYSATNVWDIGNMTSMGDVTAGLTLDITSNGIVYADFPSGTSGTAYWTFTPKNT